MADKPRLLIVSGSYPDISCGVSRHVDIVATRTAELNRYDVHVLTSDDPDINHDLAGNYSVHPFIQTWSVPQARTICEQILRLQPDVVHIQNPSVMYKGWNSLTMSRVGPLLRKMNPDLRIVVMQHDIALGKPITRCRFRPLFKSADAVTVSNQRDYQALIDQKVPESKIFLTPVTSHFDIPPRLENSRSHTRDILNIPQDAICICYFGYIQTSRNIEMLIESLAILKYAQPKIYGLIIGGPFPGMEDYYQKCQNATRQYGMTRQVTWTGYAPVSRIIHGLQAADIFVSLPERGADLRNTSIISAMLAELPIITTRNQTYYIDTDLENQPAVTITDLNPAQIGQAINRIQEKPPAPEILRARRESFLPETIWSRHIEVNHQAYLNASHVTL